MLGVIGVATLLVVLGLSLIITRLATTALTLTGLSREAARFQARSAFTGTGFTSLETEKVVDHPVRRRIIMILMILRSAGLVTIVISLILSFVGTGSEWSRLYRLLWLIGGVAVLWGICQSKWIDQLMHRMMRRAIARWTSLDTRDYASLLQLSDDYTVTELQVDEDSYLAGRPLKECQLIDEGVRILGIYRQDGTYIGVPEGSTELHVGDMVIIYGQDEQLSELDERRSGAAGDAAHQRAVSEHQQQQKKQAKKEAESEAARQQMEAENQDQQSEDSKARD